MPPRRHPRLSAPAAALLLGASLLALGVPGAESSTASAAAQGTAADVRGRRSVMLVGNNWVPHGVVREEVVARW